MKKLFPPGFAPDSPSHSQASGDQPVDPEAEVCSPHQAISLSRLMTSVCQAVAQPFINGVWTLVEINNATTKNGHVYLELSERDADSQLLARAKGVIWRSNAQTILAAFENASATVVAAGMKLLVKARPVFHPIYGLTLHIDAIDPDYTLGGLEAKKKEIRARLRKEGLFDRNRSLASPVDYQSVLVVASEGAAGLGDFQREAERLSRSGICSFAYAFSRLQGEGAAQEIVLSVKAALRGSGSSMSKGPDAIVIIRGGGAANDLAWLNDYELTRFICEQPIPVLTGIGHAQDNTLPDEVANIRFDTPSKVVAGIEQQILRRCRSVQGAWDAIAAKAVHDCRDAASGIERAQAQAKADASVHLSRARQQSSAARNDVSSGAVRRVHGAQTKTLALLNEVRQGAARDIAARRHRVPELMGSVRTNAVLRLGEGKVAMNASYSAVVDGSSAATRLALNGLQTRLHQVAHLARSAVRQARVNAEALTREVAGQGPRKTLNRGFAIVRTAQGRAVTSRLQADMSPNLIIEFRDGMAQMQWNSTKQRK